MTKIYTKRRHSFLTICALLFLLFLINPTKFFFYILSLTNILLLTTMKEVTYAASDIRFLNISGNAHIDIFVSNSNYHSANNVGIDF